MGRKQNDVFVLGEEVLLAAPIVSADSDPGGARDDWEPDGETSPSEPAGPLAQMPGPRRLAALGLGAAAAATLAALELSSAAHPQPSQTSSPSPLSARSAARASAPPAHRAPPTPPTVREPEPSCRHRALRRPPRDTHHSESRRKPTQDKAPVGSAVQVPAPPVRSAAGPAPAPPPQSPLPPSGGGGRGGRESFGFER